MLKISIKIDLAETSVSQFCCTAFSQVTVSGNVNHRSRELHMHPLANIFVESHSKASRTASSVRNIDIPEDRL